MTARTPLEPNAYLSSCRAYLDSARQRPGMYFQQLSELENQMHGHGAAFRQLGAIGDQSKTFNQLFCSWLWTVKKISASAGWAYALRREGEATGADDVSLFFTFVDEFWHTLSDSNPNVGLAELVVDGAGVGVASRGAGRRAIDGGWDGLALNDTLGYALPMANIPEVELRYHSIKMLLTLDHNTMAELLLAEYGASLRVLFCPMTAVEQRASDDDDELITIVRNRFYLLELQSDGKSIRREDLEQKIVHLGRK